MMAAKRYSLHAKKTGAPSKRAGLYLIVAYFIITLRRKRAAISGH